MPDELTITLSGEDGAVGVQVLIDALENTVEMLRQVQSQMAEPDAFRWEVVRASMQSPLAITIRPRPKRPELQVSGRDVLKEYAHAARRLSLSARPGADQVAGAVPGSELQLFAVELDRRSEQFFRRMEQSVIGDEARLTIVVPDEEPIRILPTGPSEARFEIADVPARGPDRRTRQEYGSVEGLLEEVSRHGGDAFKVWDTLTGQAVRCSITHDLLDQATTLFREGARVQVTGRVRYRDGTPVSVDVEGIRRLRRRDELPQADDIVGKVDFTGGMSSEDFVREHRDAL